MKLTAICLVIGIAAASAARIQLEDASTANPIRKVVTMLQMMQNKVKAEGEKEQELFDKFMCYCENADTTLGKSIEEAKNKVPQVQSALDEAIALKAQLEEELAQHRKDREDAKAAIAKATQIREKEAAEYAKEAGEMKANLDAMAKAIAAIEKGMSGGFLQTRAAAVLQAFLSKSVNNHAMEQLTDIDRESLTAFLSTKKAGSEEDYAPASGEIVGILKQMRDTMAGDLKDAMHAEEQAIKDYEALVAAKEKEIAAATAAIEAKLKRLGETSVEIVQLKNDLEDTQESLAEDTKFLADLAKNCALKKKEWAIRQKTRAEELLALADTIKLLNDDDALELFKKTLPSGASSASFIQVDRSAAATKQKALLLIQGMRAEMKLSAPGLDLIALALRGKKVGFEKVIKLIDDMVVTLKQEQLDDEAKRDYCTATLDAADDKKKETEHTISDLETQIADAKEAVETLAGEIDALQKGIADLDVSVARATEQRKEENAEYTTLMSSNTAAKQLIGIAKNRMNKFYNPKLYKPPPKRELTEEERITLNMGGTLEPTPPPGGIAGTGVTAFAQKKADPGPPPETFGDYKKKGEESNGVIAMMDGLIAELDKEMTEATAEEKDAQGDYEQFMSDSTDKRAEDSKSLTEKTEVKANTEVELEATKGAKASAEKDLKAVVNMIRDLHADCDFLLENYDLRAEARANEIDALGKAKAVLSGADYSFIEMGSRLRR